MFFSPNRKPLRRRSFSPGTKALLAPVLLRMEQ
jgi:hypothetical protein